jgi:hypothetical protein
VPEDRSPLYREGIAACPAEDLCFGWTSDPETSGIRIPQLWWHECPASIDVEEGALAATKVFSFVATSELVNGGGGLVYSVAAVEAGADLRDGHGCDTEDDFLDLFVMNDSSQGNVTLGNTIQYKPSLRGCPSFRLVVQVIDTGDDGSGEVASILCTTTVNVVDKNDRPVIEDGQLFYILERSETSVAVTLDPSGEGTPAAVIASDQDAGQELSFFFVGGSAEVRDWFTIGTCSGQITLQAMPLNYEDFSLFTVMLEVWDNGYPQPLMANTTVTIVVVDVNDPPEFFEHVDTFTHFSVNENSDIHETWGSSKQQVKPALPTVVFDPDGDPLTFTVTSDEEGVAFTTEAGYIMVEGGLNHESRSFLHITLHVSDGEADTSLAFVLLVVRPLPPCVPVLSLSLSSLVLYMYCIDSPFPLHSHQLRTTRMTRQSCLPQAQQSMKCLAL